MKTDEITKYKNALRVAAEQAYKEEVVDSDMERFIIGKDAEFENKNDWINSRISEWIEEGHHIR